MLCSDVPGVCLQNIVTMNVEIHCYIFKTGYLDISVLTTTPLPIFTETIKVTNPTGNIWQLKMLFHCFTHLK
jgi:hypothetical protein